MVFLCLTIIVIATFSLIPKSDKYIIVFLSIGNIIIFLYSSKIYIRRSCQFLLHCSISLTTNVCFVIALSSSSNTTESYRIATALGIMLIVVGIILKVAPSVLNNINVGWLALIITVFNTYYQNFYKPDNVITKINNVNFDNKVFIPELIFINTGDCTDTIQVKEYKLLKGNTKGIYHPLNISFVLKQKEVQVVNIDTKENPFNSMKEGQTLDLSFNVAFTNNKGITKESNIMYAQLTKHRDYDLCKLTTGFIDLSKLPLASGTKETYAFRNQSTAYYYRRNNKLPAAEHRY